MDDENVVVSPEELAEEQAAANLPEKEEIRAKLIEELGFDEEVDKEKIDKAVERDLENRKMLAKAIRQKRDWREKAAKLPDEKKKPDPKPSEQKDDLSQTDLFVLLKANIPEEDVEEVRKASKVLGKPIAETLKDPMIQEYLKTRQEHRDTAEAANVSPARPGTKKLSDEDIMAEAEKGNIPEPGTPEADQLFWARRGGKR